MGILPITPESYPSKGSPSERDAGCRYLLPAGRIKVAQRESHPPFHDPSGPPRAARPAAVADAEPALVVAFGVDGPVRRDRPSRVGAGPPRSGRAAGQRPAGSPGQPGR